MAEDQPSIPTIPAGLVDEPNTAADKPPPTQVEIDAAVTLAGDMGFNADEQARIRAMLGMSAVELHDHLAREEAIESMSPETRAMYERVAKNLGLRETEETAAELTPCCGRPGLDCVMFNPANGVVQCHRCGQQWAPSEKERLDAAELLIAQGERLAREILKHFDLVVGGVTQAAATRRDGWSRAGFPSLPLKVEPIKSIEIPRAVVELAQSFADDANDRWWSR